MKIISKKEYQRLKDIERKYEELSGETFTICNGGRSRRASLLRMNKEELVRIIFDLNNYVIQLQKKLKVSDNND